MGTSYLTSGQKDSLGNLFFDLHATFARPIAIFKTAKETVISTNPAHNFLFEGAPTNDIVQDVQQSGVFQARILYGKKQEDLLPFAAMRQAQPAIQIEEGEARIKLDATGAAFMADVERVTFDGNIFRVVTAPRPHGLFDPKFRDFYLKRLN